MKLSKDFTMVLVCVLAVAVLAAYAAAASLDALRYDHSLDLMPVSDDVDGE
jgi:hypothetical protein